MRLTIKFESPPTWQAIRKKANDLGIPAWKLAEELAFHESEETLKFPDTSNSG